MAVETPEHVEHTPGGVPVCRHCGGEVGDDGYSAGGLVEDPDTESESEIEAGLEGDTGELPQQYQAKERMRNADSDFAASLRRRR